MGDLTKEEQEDLLKIEKKDYMKPPLDVLKEFIESSTLSDKKAIQEAFNHIHSFMRDSEEKVGLLLKQRVASGDLNDPKQAGKAIAGRMFPIPCFIYIP